MKKINAILQPVLMILAAVMILYSESSDIIRYTAFLTVAGFIAAFAINRRTIITVILKLIITSAAILPVFLSAAGLADKLIYFALTIFIVFGGSKLISSINRGRFMASFVNFAVCIAIMLMLNSRYSSEALFMQVIAVFVFAFAATQYFSSNKNEIDEAAGKDQRIPSGIFSFNRILVTVLIVLAIALSFIKEIAAAVESALKLIILAIGYAIGFILKLFSSLTSSSEGAPTPTGNSGPMLPEAEESSSIFLKIMEYLIFFIASVLLAILLYMVAKKVMRLIARLIKWLSGYQNQGKHGNKETYYDIVETTGIFNGVGKRLKNKIRTTIDDSTEFFKPKTLREKIRYMFKTKVRHIKKSGIAINISDTADEIAEKLTSQGPVFEYDTEFAAKYDKARYSSEDLSE